MNVKLLQSKWNLYKEYGFISPHALMPLEIAALTEDIRNAECIRDHWRNVDLNGYTKNIQRVTHAKTLKEQAKYSMLSAQSKQLAAQSTVLSEFF